MVTIKDLHQDQLQKEIQNVQLWYLRTVHVENLIIPATAFANVYHSMHLIAAAVEE